MDISVIENEMVNNGIDVESFTKKGLLHILQIPDTRNYHEGQVEGFENIARKTLADLKSPFRFRTVVLHIPEIKTQKKIVSKLIAESAYHCTFDSFDGSLLYSYPVEQLEPIRRGKWMEDILHNHHAAIFAPKSGQGISFDME
jgi:glutamine amidotransferase PdxT